MNDEKQVCDSAGPSIPIKPTLNEWAEIAHEMAVQKGWWDAGKSKSPIEAHMLMVSEIAEACEEVRKGVPAIYGINKDGYMTTNMQEIANLKYKPEGEAIELADVMIRIFDYFGHKGWDLNEAVALKHCYNATRSHRHGGKKY